MIYFILCHQSTIKSITIPSNILATSNQKVNTAALPAVLYRMRTTSPECSPNMSHSSHTGMSIFTALHEMQTRYSDENSVCPSVCPSVRHTRDPWQNGKKSGPDFYTMRKNI